ncbi:MAG: N-6 DNA methylase [Rhodospirillales bacterium]
MARHLKKQADIGLAAITVDGGLISPDKLSEIAATPADAKTAKSYLCPKGTSLRDEISRYFRIGQAHWLGFSRIEQPNAAQCTAFVKVLLEEAFGFEDLSGPHRHSDDGHIYPISLEAKGGRVPIVVAPPAFESDGRPIDGFDLARPEFGDGPDGSRARRRPGALLQEWLNASEAALWGLAFVGDRVRLLRDNASFTRPAHIEADLGAIFRDEMSADFTALWLLIHATRFGGEGAPAPDCALERWREEGVKSGTSARERLRGNVEDALLALGQGFLEANPALREKLDSGALTEQAWFEQLLRIVYRLILLAVAEERDLLLVPDATDAQAKLYAAGYGFDHMRARSSRRNAHDPHGDAWEGAKILFGALERGEPRLGLPALGGIFSRALTPDLNDAKLSNKHFLKAVFRLSFLMDNKSRVRINWRDMATEELGSVYEGLLELVPVREQGGLVFGFAGGDEARGNARKTSGSYYTPDSLVQALLDSALDPVLDRAEAEGGAEAILKLSVIDPACGSGHFLLGAARRMASRVANLRNAEAPDYQEALRDVVRCCIHGVDRNPMAVELAKVALWIETVDPGKPLGFLDANIRCGDSLLGVFDLDVLRQGIPDEAYKPLTGDDKVTANHFKARNKAEKVGQGSLDFTGGGGSLPAAPPFKARASRVKDLPENTPREIAAKAKAFEGLRNDPEMWIWGQAADFYIAAFLLPKTGGVPQNRNTVTVPTTGHIWQHLAGGPSLYGPLIGKAQDAAREARAFHWPLEFPDVMADGGFDVVLGNPPWEQIQLDPQEWFAISAPEIANAQHMSARNQMIAELERSNFDLYSTYERSRRQMDALQMFIHCSGRYPTSSFGRLNTAPCFLELVMDLSRGRAGLIIPTGIATDSFNQYLFTKMVDQRRLAQLVDFENREKLFEAVDSRMKFCLLTLGHDVSEANFAFFLTDPVQLAEPERNFALSPETIARINPNTKTAPVFRSRKDAELTANIYKRVPVLIEESTGELGNPWRATFLLMFMMNTASNLFRTAAQLSATGFHRNGTDWIAPSGASPAQGALSLEGGRDSAGLNLSTGKPRAPQRYIPLYEAKMIHQFDHRWATYEDDGTTNRDMSLTEKQNTDAELQPRYWVPESEVTSRLAAKTWTSDWLLGWRDITNATNERTVIATAFPRVGVGNNLPIMLFDKTVEPKLIAALQGCLSSLTLDFAARHKVGGTHLNFFIYQQLPILPPSFYTESHLAFTTPRVLELSYTSHALAPFARDLGFGGPPFAWDEDRRACLRADLDAFYARAYGLTRDDLCYILDPASIMGDDYPSETFRVLKNKEMRDYGEYRTQRLVLEAWDRLVSDGTFHAMALM